MYKLLQYLYEGKGKVEVDNIRKLEVDNIRKLEEGLLKNILVKKNLYYLIPRGEKIKGPDIIYPILEVDKLEKGYNEKYYIIDMSNNNMYEKWKYI